MIRLRSFFALLLAAGLAPVIASAQALLTITAGWELQDAAKVPATGAVVSSAVFKMDDWYKATVPGTVLTTLVNNKVYPEPTYGENERPEIIPESLNQTSYWYRTVVDVPVSYAGKHIWLNFDGINYSAEVWINGSQVGTMRGAFVRGRFDISTIVKPGGKAVLAVLVTPEPHPGIAHEHTIKNGVGQNGGISGLDGPTFLSTLGWDWLDAVRDRDTGIWQKVFLSTTGAVEIQDPLVTTDLPLPKTDSADVTVQTTLKNLTDHAQKGVLKGTFGTIAFEMPVTLGPHSSQVVSFDPKTTPVLHIANPKLWWPNGYGPQNLYKLRLRFEQMQKVSDELDMSIGVRKITYSVPDSENLTISVNGVQVFIRGGDWGLDEAMKRVPRERLEAQIHLHQLAGLNMIRNWVGQSTSEDLYELCDKYGILLWDEFFQANKNDGPDLDDIDTYVANVRDKILRFRNHASIALWCARNESYPPKDVDDALKVLMTELEPTRLYQANSAEGRGVKSSGPYYWREPRIFYKVDAPFKTETGSVSVPTLESIHGMMPKKDWETIDDDWAQHDLAKGAQRGNLYPGVLAKRYGDIANLADFVRKAQLANYEAFRAMYEGREAQLFHPTTGVITWMSHPAQPSFVWQLYHYDLEPNASLFAVKKATEQQHAMFNEATGEVQVVNELAEPIEGAKLKLTVYDLDGTVAKEHEYDVSAQGYAATSLGAVEFPARLSAVHFLKLELQDADGKLISENFYWRALPEHPDDLTALDTMEKVTLDAKVSRKLEVSKTLITVTLHNPSKSIALMAHLQLRRKSGERVLPVFYSDNYISLTPGESRTITMEADPKQLKGERALVVLDGWNVEVEPASGVGVAIETNVDAEVGHWPVTGLPFATTGLR